MPRLPSLIFLLLIGVLPGCEVISPDDGDVSARVFGEALFVTNGTEARIYYFIVGRKAAEVIRWAPQLDEDRSIARGRMTRLDRVDDVVGSEDEEEAYVHWWHAVEHDGEREPGEIHTFVIGL